MSFRVGSKYLSSYISNNKINEIHMSNTPPEMSLWEKIKEFFFSNHHSEAFDCLYKLCHPSPEISREEVERLFFRLEELAAPRYKDNFCVEGNSSFEKKYYLIKDKSGCDILSVYYGKVSVSNSEASWDQIMCLPRTNVPK